MPALQRPFPLFQHKALMFVWSLDIALSNFQSLNDFPAVWLLEMMTKEEGSFKKKEEKCISKNSFCHWTIGGSVVVFWRQGRKLLLVCDKLFIWFWDWFFSVSRQAGQIIVMWSTWHDQVTLCSISSKVLLMLQPRKQQMLRLPVQFTG